jgi:hypothetical protein
MEHQLYSGVKVHNEIELCEISDLDCKTLIERALLQHRISFYIRWPKRSIFSRYRNTCVICVNDSVKEAAEELVRSICDESGYHVKFLMRKTQQYI